mgnify:CR=1 FL=1
MQQGSEGSSRGFVEDLIDQDDDFDRWYVDVVKRSELADDAPTLHIYVQDLATTCTHRFWRDPGFTEWSEALDDLVSEMRQHVPKSDSMAAHEHLDVRRRRHSHRAR